MNRVPNPFKATLGASPPFLAGREQEVADFTDALFDGPGAHERISLITGPRGVGKTVLLNAFQDAARAESWWVVSETATSGFTQRLQDAVYRIIHTHFRTHEKRLTGLSIASLGGVQFAEAESYRPEMTLRDVLSEFFTLQEHIDSLVGQPPVGLLITLDELHFNRKDELIDFGATIQHLVRENREIAVTMAGIPQSVKPLLASDSGQNPVTFLRRANKIELGLVPDSAVRTALLSPLADLGFEWEQAAVDLAVEMCGGYPFMIQLVGQYLFRAREGSKITVASVEAGADRARKRLGELVHEPSLADLSAQDRAFLAAMAHDDGASKMADIAQRLGVDPQYAGTYRRRLIDAEMITTAGYGYVDFSLPYMREYLRQHYLSN
ncbi:ATP-binding protein [Corynebacterium felinum]|uniref:Membrane protein n=1 Tax=Corynebacterium felinum TaxID=131318 RepID=A0ABU2B8E6_9CORY|nr:ATP-binding protein [Corynebacterium felinum]MDF5821471.1 ATP-binding protein [Corynebacterium felinum]MDR7354666.1 putative membrane protein [Corynebacterium felinum]WJY94030.1 hypothetical protein CFELI_01935 [Corynebacterium felinum]